MPTIDNLPEDTPNAGADLFVMWDSATGRAKKVSLTDMLTVFAAAGSGGSAAEGVTNGNNHDHSGGDGAQIDHVNLANKGTLTHTQIDAQIPSTAEKASLGRIPTADQDAALDAASSPSAGNPYMTESAVESLVDTNVGIMRFSSGATASVVASDATEEVLGTATIPGGFLGANGYIKVYTLWAHTVAVSKTMRVRLGGLSGQMFMEKTDQTVGMSHWHVFILNTNSVSGQIGCGRNASVLGGSGAATTALETGAVNTAVNVDLVITGSKSGGTLDLKAWFVEIYK